MKHTTHKHKEIASKVGKHGSEVFCKQCNKLICLRCQPVAHQTHEVCSMQQLTSSTMTQLQAQLTPLNECIRFIDTNKWKMENIRESFMLAYYNYMDSLKGYEKNCKRIRDKLCEYIRRLKDERKSAEEMAEDYELIEYDMGELSKELDSDLGSIHDVEQNNKLRVIEVLEEVTGDLKEDNEYISINAPTLYHIKEDSLFIYNMRMGVTKRQNITSPIYSLMGKVQNDQHFIVSGGCDGDKYSDITLELDTSTLTFNYICDMNSPKSNHVLVSLTNDIFYSIGGYYNRESICICEKLDMKSKCWTIAPTLNHPRHDASGCTFSLRYIYAFSGLDQFTLLHSIELLDLAKDNLGWGVLNVKFPLSWIGAVRAGSAQISPTTIMIFGGETPHGLTSKSFMLNVPTLELTHSNYVLYKSDAFPHATSFIFSHTLYVVGAEHDLHMFDIKKPNWAIIRSTNWMKKVIMINK